MKQTAYLQSLFPSSSICIPPACRSRRSASFSHAPEVSYSLVLPNSKPMASAVSADLSHSQSQPAKPTCLSTHPTVHFPSSVFTLRRLSHPPSKPLTRFFTAVHLASGRGERRSDASGKGSHAWAVSSSLTVPFSNFTPSATVWYLCNHTDHSVPALSSIQYTHAQDCRPLLTRCQERQKRLS